MAKINTVYHAIFQNIARRPSDVVELENATFGSLVSALDARYGQRFGEMLLDRKTGYFQPGAIALANGHQLDLDTALTDGDEVVFIVAMAGG